MKIVLHYKHWLLFLVVGFSISSFSKDFYLPEFAFINNAKENQESKLTQNLPQKTQTTWVLQQIFQLQIEDNILHSAISPSGSLIAVAAEEGFTLISIDKKEILWQEKSKIAINQVAFSPDELLLATAADNRLITIWDIKEEKRLKVLSLAPHLASSTTFSPDGKYLLGASYKTLGIWDTKEWIIKSLHSAHNNYIWNIRFNQKGDTFATTSTDQTVNLWKINKNNLKDEKNIHIELLKTLRAPAYWLRSAAFSPSGEFLAAASGDGHVYVWCIKNDKLLYTLSAHQGYVFDVVFLPYGNGLISGGEDGKINFWDWKKGELRASQQFEDAVISLQIVQKNHLYASLRNGKMFGYELTDISLTK